MKRFVFTMVCMMLAASIMADGKHDGQKDRKQFSPEKYYKHMEGFISKEAGLTETEQQKFFPLFKEMLTEQRKFVEEDRELMKSCKKATTEAEFEKIIDKSTSLQVESKKVEQKYYKQFGKILSWEKICKVRNAQTKFNMQALRRFSPKASMHRQHQGKNDKHAGKRK